MPVRIKEILFRKRDINRTSYPYLIEDNQTDYLGYITGGLGLIAVIIGFFSPSYQIVVFVGGIIGIGVSISWVKTSEYIEMIKTTEKEIGR